MTSYKELEEQTYSQTKNRLEELITTGIPNVKAFEKKVRDLNIRMKVLEAGSVFKVSSEHDLILVEEAMSKLRGQRRAFKEVCLCIKRKLKENQ